MKAKEISKQIETKLKKLEFKDHNGETKYNFDKAIEVKGDHFCYQIGNEYAAQEVIKRMSKINEDKGPTDYNILRQNRCKSMQKFYSLCLGLSDYSKKAKAELMKSDELKRINYLTELEFETIFDEVKQLKTKPMKKEVKETAKTEVTQIVIESYSEKAVVVWGQTKPIK